MEKTADAGDRFGLGIALQEAEEDGLQDVFGVGGITGDAVGGPEDHGVVIAEDAFQVGGGLHGRWHV